MIKNQFLNKILPHVIAVAVFLIVTLLFCKPALESDVILSQGDVTGWQGMSHQAMEYKEANGHFPLWITNMFGGMPAYQIVLEGSWSPLSVVDKVIQLGLPQPFNFFFLACICFYFLCICLGVRPYVAILGSIAFAFCSYNPIIITAGHNTKMMALAYAPAVLGAAVLIFDKKYILGFALMALLTSLQVAQGHQQITYYLFLVLGAMGISYLIRYIRKKEYRHILTSGSLIITSIILGLATNALVLMTTFDYTKDSKRGGQLVMKSNEKNSDVVKDGKTQGLSKSYAFQWSYGQAETWSLMFPGVKGYGFHQAVNESGEPSIFPKLGEDSHLYRYFSENIQGVDPNQAALNFSRNIYWGDQPFTNGPVYLGAIICFLFIIGMFYLDARHKWWILAASTFAIMLAWGSHFPTFNYFMFDYFPFYNKFRVPTLALMIPQLLFPIIAVLVVDKIVKEKESFSFKAIKKPLYFTFAVFVLIFGFYMSSDFSSENPDYMKNYEAYNKARARYEGEMNGLNEQFQDSMQAVMSSGLPVDQTAVQNYFSEKAKKIDASYSPELDKLGKALSTTPSGRDDQLRTDENISNLATQLQKNPNELSKGIIQAIREDRSELLFNDIGRSLLFVILATTLLLLFIYTKLNPIFLAAGLTILTFIDLYSFDSHYMNESNFVSKSTYEQNNFPLTDADNQILADKDPNFRIVNPAGLESSAPSYYHKSVGGYHPAKLGIYDDLMTYQLSSNNMNERVLDMLNTKYKIKDQNTVEKRATALGNAWFVNAVKYVKGPEEEMKSLDNFNPMDIAIVDEAFKSKIGSFSPTQPNETIRQSSFDNDAIVYETQTTVPHLAVFSEIYYKDWKAYIDGKSSDFVKCNYVLRAMVVPAGKHKIEFKFEPKVFYTGKQIAAFSSWLVFLLLIGSFAFPLLRKSFKKSSTPL